MRGLLLLAASIWTAAALPSWAPPPRVLRQRQSVCQDTPKSAHVTDFAAYFASDGDENKTTISFSYVDPGTGISTTCRRDPSRAPVYPIPGTLARYPCDNKLVEFSWIAENWMGKDQLSLIEASCPPANVTDPQGRRGTEASGLAFLNMTCTESPGNGTRGPGRECSSPDLDVKFSSLAPRPFPLGRI
ncbi:hypothetical protein RB595_009292 [Gaeumannomyces hyphopodioides]